MKNMKRFLAFGMAACMVMGSMTACGSGKSDSGSSDAATTDSSSSDSSGDNGEVKLTMLGWEIYQQAGMEALAAAYHEKHPNERLKYRSPHGVSTGQNWRLWQTVIPCRIFSGCTPMNSVNMQRQVCWQI